MDIQKLIEMAAGGQSPVDHRASQPHPLEPLPPGAPEVNPQRGNQILDMLNEMTGGQRGQGSDGDMMEVGNTVDGADEAAMIQQIMAQIGPAGGKGPRPVGPVPVGKEDSRFNDPIFAKIAEQWGAEQERPPETDDDFAQIEGLYTWIMEETGGDPKKVEAMLNEW